MGWTFFWAFLAAGIVLWGTFWVTRKAYSKKWDDSNDADQ